MATIEIISDNLGVYGFIVLLALAGLLMFNKEFSKESLIDYCIYMVTKILLFAIFFSFLLIFLITLIDGIQNSTELFVKQLIVIFLNYAFFNYGILYLLKFFNWIGEITKQNDLYGFEFFKKQGGFKEK